MSTPTARLNISPEMCGGPPLGDAKLSLPGLALAWATNSVIVLACTEGPTFRYIGELEIATIGAKLFTGS
jgi:hypothetical protein